MARETLLTKAPPGVGGQIQAPLALWLLSL